MKVKWSYNGHLVEISEKHNKDDRREAIFKENH